MNDHVVNRCLDCKASREYPSGKRIYVCPRCESHNIIWTPSPQTKEEMDAALLKAITGEE